MIFKFIEDLRLLLGISKESVVSEQKASSDKFDDVIKHQFFGKNDTGDELTLLGL